MGTRRRPECRIGTSGYQYDHWRGVFYPREIAKKSWFDFYAQVFDTVEINNTFYRLPEAETFDEWRERAPRGFVYALKFSRYATHLKKLKEPEASVGLFVERARRLGPHLGPILVQLPPNWGVDLGRLEAFLAAAPRRYRWAVELRDERWLVEPVFSLLERYGAALCVHDMLPRHPRRITAGWVYRRFHGERYTGSYSAQALAAEARRIEADLAAGRDVYVYFNNDAHGYAVRNAADLKRYVAGRLGG